MRLLMTGPGVLVAAACLAAQQMPASRPADDALRGVIAQYVAARDARDPAAVAALFTDDADQLVSSGEWRRGREAVVTGSLASSERTGGSRSLTLDRARYLAGGTVAIADCRYVISGLNGPDRQMWSTFVMVREGPGWRIAAIRNMLPANPVPSR